jgi:hypothetical protein
MIRFVVCGIVDNYDDHGNVIFVSCMLLLEWTWSELSCGGWSMETTVTVVTPFRSIVTVIPKALFTTYVSGLYSSILVKLEWPSKFQSTYSSLLFSLLKAYKYRYIYIYMDEVL